MKRSTQPLGIDIGATRVRVLEAVSTEHGPRARGVAARDLSAGASSSGVLADPQYVAALIEEAVAELRTKERRCVCSVGEPDALLRTVRFPAMTFMERERAARFEAQRYVDFPVEEAAVSVHPIDARDQRWALGIARSITVSTRIAALRGAGLKPIAMDHESCAFQRAVPGFDAVIDVGHQRASMHVTTDETPVTLQAYSGGADITRGIERELSIDERTAEKRKRILGTAGAGEQARSALTADIAALIRTARHTRAIVRVALVGNATRLLGLASEVEAATGVACETPVSDILRSPAYPDDVLRSSAPDWTLAAGLCLWGAR